MTFFVFRYVSAVFKACTGLTTAQEAVLFFVTFCPLQNNTDISCHVFLNSINQSDVRKTEVAEEAEAEVYKRTNTERDTWIQTNNCVNIIFK